ncbi:MAG: hypothetical protein OER80_12855 [Gammaproteobacteria bacterium]|nr:hypothetical protein [Gammaproteobacteria bacterium]MDH3767147.1 hypothetical protein [Gammaproteobacteria bacterium]
MDSIIFLIALVAVIYVLIWAIRNDDVDDETPTEGFFRMKHEEPEQGPSEDK